MFLHCLQVVPVQSMQKSTPQLATQMLLSRVKSVLHWEQVLGRLQVIQFVTLQLRTHEPLTKLYPSLQIRQVRLAVLLLQELQN